jgi:hypothetical protein
MLLKWSAVSTIPITFHWNTRYAAADATYSAFSDTKGDTVGFEETRAQKTVG